MKLKEKRMLEIMAIKQLSRKGLAALLNVDISFITKLIKGYRKASFKITKKLLDIFGADLLARAIDWEGINVSNPL